MAKKANKIESTQEAWETGLLGQDEEFVKIAELDDSLIDDSLELQMISIRLQKSLLEDLKMIASLHGVGYQPLMKQILRRFVECEKKQLLREAAAKQANKVNVTSEVEEGLHKTKKAC